MLESLKAASGLSQLMFVCGQLSFLLGAISFWSRDLMTLRVLQIFSTALGIAFNGYLMSTEDELKVGLGSVVIWLVVFFAINIFRGGKLFLDRQEKALASEIKTLFSAAFPALGSRHVDKLLNISEKLTLNDAEEHDFIHIPDNKYVYLLTDGRCLGHRADVGLVPIGRGEIIGGLSFIAHEALQEYSRLILHEAVSLYRWKIADLRKFCLDNEESQGGIIDGIAREAARIFSTHSHAGSLRAGSHFPLLSHDLLDMHAEAFPHITQAGFLRLIHSATQITVQPTQCLPIEGGLLCLKEGVITLHRAEYSHLLVKPLGREFALVYLNDMGNLELKADSTPQGASATLLYWSKEKLKDLELNEPNLYVGVLKCALRATQS